MSTKGLIRKHKETLKNHHDDLVLSKKVLAFEFGLRRIPSNCLVPNVYGYVSFHVNAIVRVLTGGKGKLDNAVERTTDDRVQRIYVSALDPNVINGDHQVANTDQVVAVASFKVLDVIDVHYSVRRFLLY